MLDDTGPSDGLLKQRRNLLITSLLLIFLQQSGATIEGLSVAGTSLKFSNPKAIYQGLWLLFFYFNLRYFQHYLDEGRARFNAIWDRKLSRNAFVQTETYVRNVVAKSGVTEELSSIRSEALKQNQCFKWQVEAGYVSWQDKSGGSKSFDQAIKIPLSILWKPIVKTCYQTIMLGSSFTNYAIPFLLSAIALGTGSFSEWNGSLLKLLFG